MDSVIMLSLRIGLLALLWLFIIVALLAMRKDTQAASGEVQPLRTQSRSRGQARQITVVEGPLAGSHMALAGLEDFTLGRGQDNDFVLGDDFASARHARLFRRGAQWFVEDLESRNGTFVGGSRIDQPEQVGVNTDIKMGRSTLRLVP